MTVILITLVIEDNLFFYCIIDLIFNDLKKTNLLNLFSV